MPLSPSLRHPLSKRWDIIVIGAGPAGCHSAAILASRGLTVLLLDPRAPWEKPCGGGLTAAALWNTPGLMALRGDAALVRELQVVAPSGASAIVPLRHPYHVVSRQVLGEWGLQQALVAGVSFAPVAAAAVHRVGGGWQVIDSAGRELTAARIIGADGAASRVRRVVAPNLRPELAPARVAYPRVGSPGGRAVFRFLRPADGYLWDFPRTDHHSVGIGVAPGTFPRRDLDTALAQYQRSETGVLEGGVAGAVLATSAWLSGSIADLGGPDYALLGDAAGLADPATGEGIDHALRSAALAASAFGRSSGFSRYPSLVRQAFGAEMRRAQWVRRWLYHPGIAERLVRQAQRSPRGALLLRALADMINEHGRLSSALARAALGRAPDLAAARRVCDCSPSGGSAPSGWGNRDTEAGAGLGRTASK